MGLFPQPIRNGLGVYTRDMVCETYEFPERRNCSVILLKQGLSKRTKRDGSVLLSKEASFTGSTMKDCPDFFGLVHPARKSGTATGTVRYIALGHIARRRQSHFLLHRCDHFLGYGQRPALEAIHTLLYHIRDMGKNFNELHEN